MGDNMLASENGTNFEATLMFTTTCCENSLPSVCGQLPIFVFFVNLILTSLQDVDHSGRLFVTDQKVGLNVDS